MILYAEVKVEVPDDIGAAVLKQQETKEFGIVQSVYKGNWTYSIEAPYEWIEVRE